MKNCRKRTTLLNSSCATAKPNVSAKSQSMKNRFLPFIIFFGTLSCNSSEPQTAQEKGVASDSVEIRNTTPLLDMPGPSSNQSAPAEYMEWGSIKVNNLLSLNSNIREVEAILGKADSTVSPDYANICPNCHFCNKKIPAFKDAYYRGVRFEQLNDSLVFRSADFSLNESLFLQSGSMRLDHRSTLGEVGKLFPEAVKGARKGTSPGWIRISPSKHFVDGYFVLEFNKDGYLTNFHYWFPC